MSAVLKEEKPRTEIFDVPGGLTLDAWPMIRKWVERAVEYGYRTITAEDLRVGLFHDEFKLFLAVRDGHVIACSIIELIQHRRRLAANIVVVAGKANTMSCWADEMHRTIEAWAKEKGCSIISGIGRRGWTKFATRRFGYQLTRVMCIKELE